MEESAWRGMAVSDRPHLARFPRSSCADHREAAFAMPTKQERKERMVRRRRFWSSLALCPAILLLGAGAGADATSVRELAYGKDVSQRLDFYPSRRAEAPLIIFVHGGGWSSGDKSDEEGIAKIGHFLDEGYAYASVNYRLVPDVKVEEQVQDVADAVGSLVSRSAELGFARNRIFLMGHSSGGHVAALIGTDPVFLERAGVDVSSIAGVILLDGAGLDPSVNPRPARPGGAFGSPADRQRLAPVGHAAAPNARSFLMLNAQSTDLQAQAGSLRDALEKQGTPAAVHIIPGRDHNALNYELGTKGDMATSIIDAYLSKSLN